MMALTTSSSVGLRPSGMSAAVAARISAGAAPVVRYLQASTSRPMPVVETPTGQTQLTVTPSGASSPASACMRGSEDGKVIVCDLATGKVRWEFQTGDAQLDMAPQAPGGKYGSGAPRSLRRAVVACGADGLLTSSAESID